MHIQVRDLVASLKAASAAVEKRNTIPVLGTVLIEEEGDGLFARGNNFDQQVDVRVCDAGRGGLSACIINPQGFERLLRGIRGGSVDIANVDGKPKVEISDGSEFSATHGSLPADDFPRMRLSEAGWSAELPRSAVDAMLRVSGAMSSEETRYYLNGVLVQFVDGWTYRFVATDGHRLYMQDVELPSAGGAMSFSQFIVPRAAINQLARLRNPKSEQPIVLSFHKTLAGNDLVDWASSSVANACSFRLLGAGDRPIVLSTKLIDGTFPDYTRVVPKEENQPTRLVVDSADLLRSIGALAGVGTGKGTRAVKLRIGDGKLQLTCRFLDPDFEGGFSLAAETVGPALEIGFNARYMLGLVEALRSERATFLLDSAASPTLVVNADDGFRAIIMPMRV